MSEHLAANKIINLEKFVEDTDIDLFSLKKELTDIKKTLHNINHITLSNLDSKIENIRSLSVDEFKNLQINLSSMIDNKFDVIENKIDDRFDEIRDILLKLK